MNLNYEDKPARQKAEGDELSIIALIDALWDHKKMIVAFAAAFLVVGGLYAFLTAPVYSSKILVAIEDSPDGSATKSLLGDVSAMFDVKSSADGEIQILGSRMVASRTVDALKLNVEAQPRYFPLVGRWIASHSDGLSSPGLLGWGGFTWGTESIQVASFDVPRELRGRRFMLVALANGQYRLSGDGLAQPVVGTVGKAQQFQTSFGVVSLNVHSLSARAGANFVLECRSRQVTTDDLIKSLQIVEQGKRSGVIGAMLEGTNPVLVSSTLNELARQYVTQNVNRKTAQAEQSIQFLETQLPAMRRQLEDAEAKLSQYQNEHTVVDLSEAGKVMLQQSAQADTQLAALQQKRQELATRFGPAHPALHAIDEQIGASKQQMDQIAERIRKMPLAEQDLLKLQRDVRVDTDLYVAMRSDVEQMRLLKAGKIGNVRLVDSADVPELPVKPRKLMILIAAAVAGLFLGMLSAILKDRLFTGITDADSLEELTGLNVYATIPFSDRQDELSRQRTGTGAKRPVLAELASGDPAVESLRSLRTALKFALLGASNNVVLITGPTPGIGKSFVSVNLAAVLAAGGQRVLLIDADMRRGYLNEFLGVQRGNGLAEAIVTSQRLATVAHCNVLPNLDVVTTGKLPPNPSELLSHCNWNQLIAQAAEDYDLLIIDAPPVLPVADAEVIANSAGTVFLVTRFAVTRAGDITESIKRLEHTTSKVTGLLFNSVKSRSGIYGGRTQRYRYVDYSYQKSPV